jgi:dUTP pyrophosphatase
MDRSIYFEKVSKYADDADVALPIRKTQYSAGYDLAAAEDYIIPSLWQMAAEAKEVWPVSDDEFITMELLSKFTKQSGFKPTLVSTGIKCKLDPNTYLQLSVRSSLSLKHWLILANGVGIIDADYYNNEDNEGEIYLQLYNLSPYNVQIKKGEMIGQGVILPYYTVTEGEDSAGFVRTGGLGSTGYNYEGEKDESSSS